MKYEKSSVEVICFDNNELFMAWIPTQGVDSSNVYEFLASIGITPDQIETTGGVDALQINASTHTVICSGYKGCYGQQFQW